MTTLEPEACLTCGVPLVRGERGRPARYCGIPCRRAAEYALKRINSHLARIEWDRDEVRRRLATGESHAYSKRERERERARLEHQLGVLDAEVTRYQTELARVLRGGECDADHHT